jgi:hypothetical protein
LAEHDGGPLALPAARELGDEARALGVGHLSPAGDFREAAPAAEAEPGDGVERADARAGAFDHGMAAMR